MTDIREARTVASLSKLERQWLKRQLCGWCEISMMSKSCGAIGGYGEPCNMDELMAKCLERYRPRPVNNQGKHHD